MKKDLYITPAAIIFLGITVILHGVLPQMYTAANSDKPEVNVGAYVSKDALTLQDTALYLNISEEQVTSIINQEQEELSKTGTFSGRMFPYLQIDGKYIFSKQSLNKWLEESTEQRKEYQLK